MTSSSSEAPTYRMRFEFRVSHNFNVESRELEFDLAGRGAVLKAVHERPLKQTDAVTIQVGAFQTDAEALEFGQRLQRATILAAVKTDLGVDVGKNRVRSGVSEGIRQKVLNDTGFVLRDRVHGVDVYREDIPVRIFLVEAHGTVTQNPQDFLAEVSASYTEWSQPMAGVEQALRLRAEASLARENLARMILAIASVEALTPDEFWTDRQAALLRHLAASASSFPEISQDEIDEVVERITGQRKISVSQGFRRLFHRIGLQALWPRWRELYAVRSRVLHGDAPPDLVLNSLDEVLRLSKEIVLTAAAHEIRGQT